MSPNRTKSKHHRWRRESLGARAKCGSSTTSWPQGSHRARDRLSNEILELELWRREAEATIHHLNNTLMQSKERYGKEVQYGRTLQARIDVLAYSASDICEGAPMPSMTATRGYEVSAENGDMGSTSYDNCGTDTSWQHKSTISDSVIDTIIYDDSVADVYPTPPMDAWRSFTQKVPPTSRNIRHSRSATRGSRPSKLAAGSG